MKNKKVILHGVWIILLSIMVFFIVKIGISLVEHPNYVHHNEYNCIDKTIEKGRKTSHIYYMILKDVTTNEISEKEVEADIYYSNDIGDNLILDEEYNDLTKSEIKNIRKEIGYIGITFLILFVYLAFCNHKNYFDEN